MKKTFEINYKYRYGQTEDWGSECVKTENKKEALRIFAARKKIKTKKFKSFEDWIWEEGVWSAYFKSIKQVNEKTYPHCGGTEIVHI